MWAREYRQNPIITYQKLLALKNAWTILKLHWLHGPVEPLKFIKNTSTNPTLITATDENYMYTGDLNWEKLHQRLHYSGRNYTILGRRPKETFCELPATGNTIRIQGKPYLVVGVLAEKGPLAHSVIAVHGYTKLCSSEFFGAHPTTSDINAPNVESLNAVQGQSIALRENLKMFLKRDNFSITRSDSVAVLLTISITQYLEHHHSPSPFWSITALMNIMLVRLRREPVKFERKGYWQPNEPYNQFTEAVIIT